MKNLERLIGPQVEMSFSRQSQHAFSGTSCAGIFSTTCLLVLHDIMFANDRNSDGSKGSNLGRRSVFSITTPNYLGGTHFRPLLGTRYR